MRPRDGAHGSSSAAAVSLPLLDGVADKDGPARRSRGILGSRTGFLLAGVGILAVSFLWWGSRVLRVASGPLEDDGRCDGCDDVEVVTGVPPAWTAFAESLQDAMRHPVRDANGIWGSFVADWAWTQKHAPQLLDFRPAVDCDQGRYLVLSSWDTAGVGHTYGAYNYALRLAMEWNLQLLVRDHLVSTHGLGTAVEDFFLISDFAARWKDWQACPPSSAVVRNVLAITDEEVGLPASVPRTPGRNGAMLVDGVTDTLLVPARRRVDQFVAQSVRAGKGFTIVLPGVRGTSLRDYSSTAPVHRARLAYLVESGRLLGGARAPATSASGASGAAFSLQIGVHVRRGDLASQDSKFRLQRQRRVLPDRFYIAAVAALLDAIHETRAPSVVTVYTEGAASEHSGLLLGLRRAARGRARVLFHGDTNSPLLAWAGMVGSDLLVTSRSTLSHLATMFRPHRPNLVSPCGVRVKWSVPVVSSVSREAVGTQALDDSLLSTDASTLWVLASPSQVLEFGRPSSPGQRCVAEFQCRRDRSFEVVTQSEFETQRRAPWQSALQLATSAANRPSRARQAAWQPSRLRSKPTTATPSMPPSQQVRAAPATSVTDRSVMTGCDPILSVASGAAAFVPANVGLRGPDSRTLSGSAAAAAAGRNGSSEVRFELQQLMAQDAPEDWPWCDYPCPVGVADAEGADDAEHASSSHPVRVELAAAATVLIRSWVRERAEAYATAGEAR